MPDCIRIDEAGRDFGQVFGLKTERKATRLLLLTFDVV
jgi:hypothetical protein